MSKPLIETADFTKRILQRLQQIADHVGRIDLRSAWLWGTILFFQCASLFIFDFSRREIVNSQAPLIIFASFVGYWIFYPLLIAITDRPNQTKRWAWIGIGLLTLGISRGFALENIFTQDIASAWNSFLERLPGDITIGLITVVAISELMFSTKRHVYAMTQLSQANGQLLENRKATGNRASLAEASLREMAQSALVSELDRIKLLVNRANKWSEVRSVADEIRELISNQVRPLSQRLRDRIDDLRETKELKQIRKPLKFGRPHSVNAYLDTRIVGTYLFSMPNILVTINSLASARGAFIAFGASLAVFPIGLALRKLASYSPIRNRWVNWLLVHAILIAAYLPLQITVEKLIAIYPDLQPVRYSGIGVYIFVGLTVALWRAVERSRAEIEMELFDLNQQLQRSTAVVEQQIWIAQKKWAYLVHGTVQGALTVAASRLQLADKSQQVDVQQILSDLDKASIALKGDESEEQPFEHQVQETKTTWDGVLNIEIAMGLGVATLVANPTTARCTSEIIKELAGNAYRHGKAKNLVIHLGVDDQGDLHLTASNDGLPLTNQESGLGTALFTDLTMSWSMSQDAQGVNFEAKLPAINS